MTLLNAPKTEPTLRRYSRLVVAVDVDDDVVGYIESVGRVFVALAGPTYLTAVEVGQALTAARAVVHLTGSD